MTIMAFLLFVIFASVCACLAEGFVPGRIPGGFFTAVMTGILGAWIGANLLGKFGPDLEGLSLLPTAMGSVILVSVLAVLSELCRKEKA